MHLLSAFTTQSCIIIFTISPDHHYMVPLKENKHGYWIIAQPWGQVIHTFETLCSLILVCLQKEAYIGFLEQFVYLCYLFTCWVALLHKSNYKCKFSMQSQWKALLLSCTFSTWFVVFFYVFIIIYIFVCMYYFRIWIKTFLVHCQLQWKLLLMRHHHSCFVNDSLWANKKETERESGK